MFYRWWCIAEDDRGRVWRLYGWYSALMACGSCFGIVAWSSKMTLLATGHMANSYKDMAQRFSTLVLTYSLNAAFNVTYAIEFLCLSAAELMVLDRMFQFFLFSSFPTDAAARKRWVAAARVLMVAVVLGNAVGLAANIASAVHYQKASEAAGAASASYASSSTKDGDAFRALSRQELQRAGSILSVQLFCELAVLLLTVVAFVVVAALCARRVKSSLLGVEAASQAAVAGRALQLRMLGTTAFVFVAFLLRSVFAAINAVAFQLRDINVSSTASSCPLDICDPTCYNVYTLIARWMSYTPEFQSMVVLISSPLALLVALWGMTNASALQLMLPHRRASSSSWSTPTLVEPSKLENS
jgi:hypothetical protein